MKKQLMMAGVGLVMALSSGAVFASDCPNLAAKVQAAVDARKGDADSRVQAKMLLSEGQRLHETGEHDKSVEMLGKALALLEPQ